MWRPCGRGDSCTADGALPTRKEVLAVTRDFTVATFVVCRRHVLLLKHCALDMWLPPGGHIEPHELPDEAAVREVGEETGIEIELVGRRGLPIARPRQLMIPQGVQVERIGPDHEHVDFVYFGRPVRHEIERQDGIDGIGRIDGAGGPAMMGGRYGTGVARGKHGPDATGRKGLPALRGNEESTRVGWYDRDALGTLGLSDEVCMWTERALKELTPVR